MKVSSVTDDDAILDQGLSGTSYHNPPTATQGAGKPGEVSTCEGQARDNGCCRDPTAHNGERTLVAHCMYDGRVRVRADQTDGFVEKETLGVSAGWNQDAIAVGYGRIGDACLDRRATRPTNGVVGAHHGSGLRGKRPLQCDNQN